MANGEQPQTDGPFWAGVPFGAGAVLVVLPSVALYLLAKGVDKIPTLGLPILAILGIMILFGTLALVATLFARLGLSDKDEALALPEGSIRAAIALSLIVLFAIISIMLYQSINKPYAIPVMGETARAAVVREFANRVIAVVPEACVSPADAALANCPAENIRFSVHVIQPAGQESTDLAKQLLILIGTLMTSVTSFYFASRANVQNPPQAPERPGAGSQAPGAQQGAANVPGQTEDHVDGCDVPITDSTQDKDLPAAEGGVQR